MVSLTRRVGWLKMSDNLEDLFYVEISADHNPKAYLFRKDTQEAVASLNRQGSGVLNENCIRCAHSSLWPMSDYSIEDYIEYAKRVLLAPWVKEAINIRVRNIPLLKHSSIKHVGGGR